VLHRAVILRCERSEPRRMRHPRRRPSRRPRCGLLRMTAMESAPSFNKAFKHTSAFSPRDAPELLLNPSPIKRGRSATPKRGAGNAGCALHPRSRVRNVQKKMHTSIQVQRRASGIPRAMVLTVSFELFPVIGLCCHRHRRDAKHHRQLDVSVETSEPHDFAVRKITLSSSAPLASITSPPYVRDDRETPLVCGPGWRGIEK
jgi:hypothetical protein